MIMMIKLFGNAEVPSLVKTLFSPLRIASLDVNGKHIVYTDLPLIKVSILQELCKDSSEVWLYKPNGPHAYARENCE